MTREEVARQGFGAIFLVLITGGAYFLWGTSGFIMAYIITVAAAGLFCLLGASVMD